MDSGTNRSSFHCPRKSRFAPLVCRRARGTVHRTRYLITLIITIGKPAISVARARAQSLPNTVRGCFESKHRGMCEAAFAVGLFNRRPTSKCSRSERLHSNRKPATGCQGWRGRVEDEEGLGRRGRGRATKGGTNGEGVGTRRWRTKESESKL